LQGQYCRPGVHEVAHRPPLEVVDHGIHGKGAHPLRVLHHKGVDFSIFKPVKQKGGRIESDELDFPGQAFLAKSKQHPGRHRLTATEDTVGFTNTGHEVERFRLGISHGGSCPPIVNQDFDTPSFLDGFQEALLPTGGAGRTHLVSKQDHLAGSSNQLAKPCPSQPSSFEIVGGNQAQEILADFAFEGGVKDDHWNSQVSGPSNRGPERLVIEGGQEKTVHVLREELLNQLDLLGPVVFLEGTLPDEFHSLFIRGFSGPLFHRFPKGMGGPLGNHGDDRRSGLLVFRAVRVALASEGKTEERQQEKAEPHEGRSIGRGAASLCSRMPASATIKGFEVTDVRFPTSDLGDGSDAMHTDPDYSAAYVVLNTDAPGLKGHGLAFTLGRGTEIVVQAVRALEPLAVGRCLDEIRSDWAGFWRSLTSEPQLRWVGPEKGVIHLATAAVVNGIWDLAARAEEKPLWKLVADMTPEELVDCVDFRYIDDFLSPDEALEILSAAKEGQSEREEEISEKGYPAYITSVGWLGYDDEKIQRLCREGLEQGWNWFKMKVGSDLEDDRRRASLVRECIGPERELMMDANQKWSVPEAMAWMEALAEFRPLWIEEPTSPDDVLGHAAIARAISPIGVATGEQCANRVIFKQLLQAEAISFCQLDSCRLGGFNEVLAVMLMAAKAGVPVCPHAGGVGLCEHVAHLLAVDYLCVSGSMEGRAGEWVDHLHEHFEAPARAKDGRYLLPHAPGYGVAMKPDSVAAFSWPDGKEWKARGKG